MEELVMKKRLLAVVGIFLLSICVIGIVLNQIDLQQTYSAAVTRFDNGQFEEAKEAFSDIEWYKDSKEMIEKCEKGIEEEIKEEKYQNILSVYKRMSSVTEEEFNPAIIDAAYLSSISYKDSEKIYASMQRRQTAFEKEKREAEAQKEQERLQELKRTEPYIGMTAEEVRRSAWGTPDEINRTTTKYGTSEQWVYEGFNYDNKYVYLDDGIVTAIQE